MTTTRSLPGVLCAILALVATVWVLAVVGSSSAGEPEARLLVGPDLLASRDGTFPHLEPTVAANPRDASNLVGAAMTFPRPDQGVACKVYSSRDGGSTWKPVELEEQIDKGLGDPQVAFTPRGTAIFACLTQGSRDTGRPRAALRVYRSEDGGVSWEGPADAGPGSYDHPVLAVDSTAGPHAGKVYFGVLYGREEAVLGVFRSTDDGRHFVGPVEIARSAEEGLLLVGLGVLSDGTLAASYTRTPRGSGFGGEPGESVFEMVTSGDGGVTFSDPVRIGTRVTRPRERTEESRISRLGTVPMWAMDGSDTATRDRLYLVWSDWRSDAGTGVWRVVVSSSSDRGETWSEPRELDPDAPAEAHQFLPVAAVSRDGVLGVGYFDSRGFPDLDGYHQRFTASVDGGATFLPSRRISSRPSRPAEAAEHDRAVLLPVHNREAGVLYLAFMSAEGRWPIGGDYMGLAADARGVFHPFWTDSREGTFQVWTGTVRVERTAMEGGDSGPEMRAESERGKPRPVTGRVQVVSDPVVWNPATRELRVPVRLQNVSDQPFYPPLQVQVLRMDFGRPLEELPPETREYWRERIPVLLNADNGESGAGAVYDYSGTLRDLETLEPGAVTGARVWRIRGRKDAMAPIQVEVRAVVPETAP
jgi:hypothetical protein